MPLTLLTGPAGSGKTGEILERFGASLGREPVLVVPTGADVERFEDELLTRRPVALGGRIVTFGGLFRLVAGALGVVEAPPLSAGQRRALVGAVVREVSLEALAGSARRRGFPGALDRFIGEAQAALVAPGELAERVRAAGWAPPRRRFLEEVAALYAEYVQRREALGRSDAHSLALAAIPALRARPGAWGGRPVLIHGFDDLTEAQLAMVEALAAAADVVVSVVHEPDRACLAARRRLVERLERLGEPSAAGAPAEPTEEDQAPRITAGARPPTRTRLSPRAGVGLLAHLERAFMTDAPERRQPDGSLRLLQAAGARNEIEQVAAAIARLLRGGAAPAEVAVIARSTESCGALVEDVLGSYGIPTAVHGERPLMETGVGRALAALVRAALTTRRADDLVRFLRCPGRAADGSVDRLERAVRVERIESADEALDRWQAEGARRPWEIDALRAAAGKGAPALLERAADVARHLFEQPRRRRAQAFLGAERTEQLAAECAASALADVAELSATDPALAPDAEELVRVLEGLRVPRSHEGTNGRVEVMTPYRARARQFPYVFVLSLQEGEFPRRRRDQPFLTDGERRAVGLPEPADQRDEERYLFYVCLTRATRRLHLSFRSADEDGGAVTRSFFVDEVLDALVPDAEPRLTVSRGLSATAFDPATAPTERELARALAERRLGEPPAVLGASGALAGRLAQRLARARDRAGRLPGPLRVPFVREAFAAKRHIGASSLELYAECPFRYFVDHELAPSELAPRPEALTRGGTIHRVLERLYRELGGRPTQDTLDAAIDRARALLGEEARGTSLDPRRPAAHAVYRRMESDVARFLHYDAEEARGAVVGLEASFGAGGEDDKPALELAGFGLHGKIDRIDEVAPGMVLIRDYKTGSKAASRKRIRDDKRLQLPLYMLAARELWGLEPVGGVYHPLGKQHEATPRGLLRGPRRGSPLAERFTSTDYTEDEEDFHRQLDAAREEAERLAGEIHAGHLARAPLGGSCPEYCDFHPICRRERGDKDPEDERGREDTDD